MFSPTAAAAAAAMLPAGAPPFQVVPYGVEIANRVFVGGCPYNVSYNYVVDYYNQHGLQRRHKYDDNYFVLLQMTELELTKFFSKFGEVKDAKIITDRDGGKSRGLVGEKSTLLQHQLLTFIFHYLAMVL